MTSKSKSKEPAPKQIPKLLRPNEFFTTMFSRLAIRRLPFLYVGFGEADTDFILGSDIEDEIVYGSPTYSTGLIRITDPELLERTHAILEPFGYTKPSETREPFILDLRDVSSFMNKYKTVDDYVLEKDIDNGRTWYMVNKKQKKEDGGGTIQVPKYIREQVVALFRFKTVLHWSSLFGSLIDGTRDPVWRVPFSYEGEAHSFVYKIDQATVEASPIGKHYPAPIRCLMTRGIDFLDPKFLEKSKYPIDTSDMVFWCESGHAIRCAQVINAPDFSIAIGRPNAVFLPPSAAVRLHSQTT